MAKLTIGQVGRDCQERGPDRHLGRSELQSRDTTRADPATSQRLCRNRLKVPSVYRRGVFTSPSSISAQRTRTSYARDVPNDGDASQDGGELVAVGMDLAAVGISWVPMAGAPVAALLQGVTNRQLRRRICLIEQVLDDLVVKDLVVNDLDDRLVVLEKLMAAHEADAELVEDAARYADHCRCEEGIRLMGRIVAFGVSSRTELGMGMAHLLLDAVGRLQPEHLTLVREFAILRHVSEHADQWSPGQRERGRQSLVQFLPALSDLIDPLIGGPKPPV